jgi:hypothetical protein
LTTTWSISAARRASTLIADVAVAALGAGDLRCAKRRADSVAGQRDDGFGMVAENISVRRSSGAASRMNSRSSRKPMSSISSASSRTTAASFEQSSAPRSRWSRRRPGVPTTICAPSLSQCRSRLGVHAADAGDDARLSLRVKPFEFALDLQRQFARRRDDEGGGRELRFERVGLAQKLGREGETEGDGLAGAGLRGDDEIAPGGLIGQHGGLHGGGFGIAVFGQGFAQNGGKAGKGHWFRTS